MQTAVPRQSRHFRRNNARIAEKNNASVKTIDLDSVVRIAPRLGSSSSQSLNPSLLEKRSWSRDVFMQCRCNLWIFQNSAVPFISLLIVSCSFPGSILILKSLRYSANVISDGGKWKSHKRGPKRHLLNKMQSFHLKKKLLSFYLFADIN